MEMRISNEKRKEFLINNIETKTTNHEKTSNPEFQVN